MKTSITIGIITMGLLTNIFGSPKNKPYEVVDIFTSMRENIFNLSDPEKSEISGYKKGDRIAIIMETGLDDAFYTLVAVNDGTSSLYFSNGGGIIGAGEYPQVSKVAKEFLSESEKYESHFSSTDNFPFPKPNFTRFYIVKGGSILTVECKEDDLGNGKLPLSQLFHKGHELIGMIRIADEQRNKK